MILGIHRVPTCYWPLRVWRAVRLPSDEGSKDFSAVTSGMRRSEFLAPKWQNVNFSRGTGAARRG